MQYFFFEKYLMQPDSFVYINATLMLISSALFIKDLGSCFMSPYSRIRNNFPCTIGTPSGCLDGWYNLKWIEYLPIDIGLFHSVSNLKSSA